MAFDRITLSHFRNHAASALDGTAHFNLLVGENGAGKTNVLEALSLFAPGRGLRRASLAEIAGASGPGNFAVSALLSPGDGGDPVKLGTGTQPHRPGRRIVQVNGADASAVSLGEWLAMGWLTPAMDRLFADSAGARRRYMDRLAVAIEPGHARHATRYEQALRERNRLLSGEDEPDRRWLDSIEAQLAETGSALAQGRARLVARLTDELARLPDQPFARPALTYAAGGPVDEAELAGELQRQRRRERAAQRTLVGPHRDELDVTMAGKNAPAASCSTGEQKAMLIAITLAHSSLSAAGRPGLLLLDEVAAHLDPIRRAALFERLRGGASQIWLTGTERAPFAEIEGEAAIWHVAGGMVERVG
ncbi:DNA replication and repair protein RecF [Altererythrobacter atlanticus]|uniref:DNA replication and repair protein RecF n=1 Tax=Croceibacterium atlanticum TaxID=1267766 RepID=A0A0F7KRY0_9SPHN|nr:DNA replication/repair protein RecF [Croceibacterium atlanticum]AKH42349.1 DNA replication and repair protein RecF [Croceibacterium atlanticum]MBB5731126.1 DNA replication and repair protein RecF [Croceibacterium atlanticum]